MHAEASSLDERHAWAGKRPRALAIGWEFHPLSLFHTDRLESASLVKTAYLQERSGAGVEPTEPWVARPHRF